MGNPAHSTSSRARPPLRPGLRPLVILGAARSGTKLLRSLLGQSAHCATVPYGVNHIWRMGLSPEASDRRPARDATPRRKEHIRAHLLSLAQAKTYPRQGVLVEKTCANTLRVPFVDRILPDAIYVHILRDGRDVAVSAREAWNRSPSASYLLQRLRNLPYECPSHLWWHLQNLWRGVWKNDDSANVWGPRYENIRTDRRNYSLLEVCARQWRACVTTCLQDLQHVPEDRVYTLRYERLTRDPTVLSRLADALGLSPDPLLSYHHTVVHDHSVGRWRRDLSSPEQDELNALLAPTLDAIGAISSR